MLESCIRALDLGFYEVREALRGLQDEHVWVRPAPGLLSVGELAGHIAYWEAVRFGGDSPNRGAERDLTNCRIKSPLLDPQFGYYTDTVLQLPTEAHRALTAAQVEAELLRVHREAMDSLRELNPDFSAPAPHWSPQSNYGELLDYMAFHVAYHTGQMYSVRHLRGEETPDN